MSDETAMPIEAVRKALLEKEREKLLDEHGQTGLSDGEKNSSCLKQVLEKTNFRNADTSVTACLKKRCFNPKCLRFSSGNHGQKRKSIGQRSYQVNAADADSGGASS